MSELSIRRLLCPEEAGPKPVERCVHAMSPQELKQLYKLEARRIFRPSMLLILVFVIFIVLMLAVDMAPFVIGMAVGYIFLVITEVFSRIGPFRRHRSKDFAELGGQTDHFEFYSDCLYYALRDTGETVRAQRVKYSDLARVRRSDEFLILTSNREIFYIPLRCFASDSPVFDLLLDDGEVIRRSKKSRLVTLFSRLLIWACVLLMWADLFDWLDPGKSSLTLGLCLLIPMASFVYGLVMAVKGRGFIINIVAGVLTAVIILLSTWLPILTGDASDYYDYDYEAGDEYVEQTEQLLDIDFMEYESSETSSFSLDNSPVRYIYIYYTEDMWQSVSRLLTDSRWSRQIPTALNSIASPHGSTPHYDYIIIYNVDTGEYNSLPEQSGTYHFITLTYNNEWNDVQIADYYIDFIA